MPTTTTPITPLDVLDAEIMTLHDVAHDTDMASADWIVLTNLLDEVTVWRNEHAEILAYLMRMERATASLTTATVEGRSTSSYADDVKRIGEHLAAASAAHDAAAKRTRSLAGSMSRIDSDLGRYAEAMIDRFTAARMF